MEKRVGRLDYGREARKSIDNWTLQPEILRTTVIYNIIYEQHSQKFKCYIHNPPGHVDKHIKVHLMYKHLQKKKTTYKVTYTKRINTLQNRVTGYKY